jgi:hypothetical protein
MSLTHDEYTCLMIMAEGQNLIAMKDTRWHAPLMSLHAKDFCKGVGNNNYVISERGRRAVEGHEETLSADIRQLVTKQRQVQESRQAVHAKMQTALAAIVEAAQMSALTTGNSETHCMGQIMQEIQARALERLK